jgi:hypothetical protein
VRTSLDVNPAWQCPRCEVAYAKVAARAGPMVRALVVHGREMAGEARSDYSLLVLIAVNLVVLGIAYRMQMSLVNLMLVYWIQSMIIGFCHVARILLLDRFSTEDLTLNNRPLDESRRSKIKVAWSFAFMYGFFHLLYFVFIIAAISIQGQQMPSPTAYLLCAAAFAINHAFSLHRNVAKDAAGRPNIGTLMGLPFARVFPMHLMIATGLFVKAGAWGLLLFGLLKTAADAAMHVLEHHVMGSSSPPKS